MNCHSTYGYSTGLAANQARMALKSGFTEYQRKDHNHRWSGCSVELDSAIASLDFEIHSV